jgi:iron complex transport system substrate-binding protein
VKIVSLLPSATEIVYALGLGDSLEGVTFECDFPSSARTKPVVSGTALPEGELSAREIDDVVSATVASGEPIYTLDAERIRSIQPDLILAQDLCRVCAVPSGAVSDALGVLGCQAEVLSLDPSTLADVVACIGLVGEATGTGARARTLVADLNERLDRVRQRVAGLERPRTFALEWSDPPFTGGHWVPDMITAAGGQPVLGAAGVSSRRVTWEDVAAAAPEVTVFMPCGYGLSEAVTEASKLPSSLGRLFAVDATSYFSRPGPRIVDGVEILGWALHPDAMPAPPPGTIAALQT